MSKVIASVSFKLNNENLLDDWKKLSTTISEDLATVDGFISRDSAKGEDGSYYCFVKWGSMKQQEAFMKHFEGSEEFGEMMAEFGRIVNMETMKHDILEVV